MGGLGEPPPIRLLTKNDHFSLKSVTFDFTEQLSTKESLREGFGGNPPNQDFVINDEAISAGRVALQEVVYELAGHAHARCASPITRV